MISDEEAGLWRLVAANEPGAMDVYLDWLLTHDPVRGQLAQKRHRGGYRAMTSQDSEDEGAAWRALFELDRPAGHHQFYFDPLPRKIFTEARNVSQVEPIVERLPFLEITVWFEDRLTDAQLAEIFALTVFAKIRRLSINAFSEVWDYDDTVDPMVQNYLPTVTGYFGEPVLAALCASEHVSELEALWLSDQEFGASCAERLAAVPFRRLRELAISGEPIGDAGAIALASSPVVATLRRLSLRGCRIGDAGALALAESAHLVNLEELDMMPNDVGPAGVRALRARFPNLRINEP
jgi:hypothetical protein